MTKMYKSLILSSALAVLACAVPLPGEQDPCAILGSLNTNETTVQHVADCYNSIEFNSTEAKATLDSLHILYDDFFVFRDSALTPDLALPFVSEPVDVLSGLDAIRGKSYAQDYEFHSDLALLIKSLNDAHCTYSPNCYNSFIFKQPLALYAPVVDGHQSIRVFLDTTGQDYTDCEVLEINGLDARSYIQAWADRYSGFSKDAGVRFNNALVSHMYNAETQTWSLNMGAITETSILPSSSHVDYRLRCGPNGPGHGHSFHLNAPWSIVNAPAPGTFTDKASFLQQICLAAPASAPTPQLAVNLGPRNQVPVTESESLTLYRRKVHMQEFNEKKRLLEKRADGSEQVSELKDLPDATFVDGAVTAVYQLKSKPSVGVLVIPTMLVNTSTEVPAIQARLALLAERNVTNIIIDTSSNGGGDVSFAYLLSTIFFPSLDKKANSHLARFKVTPAATALASANLANTSTSSYFDPRLLTNKATGLAFATNPFLEPVTMKINDHEAEYTDEFYINFDPTMVDQNVTHPWTGDASKITLLTDGQCGSACGMTTDLFVKHGVKAVGVGGHSKSELSMFSFAGASVIGLDAIVDTFERLSVPPTLARLPYKNQVNVDIIEIYSGNDTIPLEYNPARYAAALRLDYTPETARNHDQLWNAVAETAWSI
ncbi:hypothetical protein BGZ80_010666 [Entomortierella chlamydospora]|uniref:Tail specific protease domain-containing protein n=1 Tax=Entomortierella chlamydospora TaxID=101097 RepID=A0A9P6SZP6_9FUNG|nr:hypothetical protein BGZ79_003983 [Entomortierella chlamydospora]KAG0014063.1 hypothetical protein BGZ80_010666 [Entomortierella chlamydospora]